MSSNRIRFIENEIFRRLESMFSVWLRRVNHAVLDAARRLGVLPDPTGVFMVAPQWDRLIEEVVIPDLSAAASIGWSEAFQRPTFSSTNSHVLGALQGSQNLLSNIPNEVHDFIVDDISRGLSAGESREQIVQRIDLTLQMTGSDRWTRRANMIAVTEVTRAANAGALAAAISAEQSVGTLLKRWNDSGDHRVRETHQQVHGTELPLMQPFQVGGFPLLYPSEPFGPPEEVVGCRCDLSFRRADP